MRPIRRERLVRTVLCLSAGIVLACLALAGRSEPARALAREPYGVGPPPNFAHTPSASCSASACHGGGSIGARGSEHSTWAAQVPADGDRDPHSHAYRVLFNEDSIRIAKLLGGGLAHENLLCLKCHAPAGVSDRDARADGVGCTACHGPSEKWISEHYLPAWKTKSNRDKWNEGFIPSTNLVARISNCASCHVGSPDREVNHDLIAAGHPRLAFEYAAFHYHSDYRKHWAERAPQPDFEARAWIVGQAASVRAAVAVLGSRAANAQKNKAPWPEFAEYSCFACHQKIDERAPKAANRLLGLPGWQVWYTATLNQAATGSHGTFATVDLPELKKLAQLQAFMAQAHPKAKDAESKAAAALAELDAWLARMQQAEDANWRSLTAKNDLDMLARALATGALHQQEWDALAMHYLGNAAVYHAGGGAGTYPTWTDDLTAIRNELLFPRFPGRFNSPSRFDEAARNRVRGYFIHLQEATFEGKNR
jgi:hypothetical protein